jgi:hypothetical protein
LKVSTDNLTDRQIKFFHFGGKYKPAEKYHEIIDLGLEVRFPMPMGLLPLSPTFSSSPQSLADVSKFELLERLKSFYFDISRNIPVRSQRATLLCQLGLLRLGGNPNQVRSTQTKELRTRYICLSHRWGLK